MRLWGLEMQTFLLLFKYNENHFHKAFFFFFAPSLKVWGGDDEGWHWKVPRTPQDAQMNSPELKWPGKCDVFTALKLAIVLTFKYF